MLEKTPEGSGEPPAPFIESAPPRNGLRAALAGALVVSIAVLALLLTSDRGEESTDGGVPPAESQTSADDGEPRGDEITMSGKHSDGTRITVTFPGEVSSFGVVPMRVEGRLARTEALGGASGVAKVMRLSAQTCPKRPPADDGVGAKDILGVNVFDAGPFHAGGRDHVSAEAGTYAVCAYLPKSGQQEGELIASSTLRVVDPVAPEAPYDRWYVQPGVYAASGADVEGGIDGAAVEFEVRETPGTMGRDLAYIAVSGVRDPRETGTASASCERAQTMRTAFYSDEESSGTVYDTVSALGLDSGVSLTGGSWKDGEFLGQVYVSEGTCRSLVTFTARLEPGSARPLRAEVRKTLQEMQP